ncbi:hypothetical protein CDV55_104763 [Aspergillus turcosus]|nr:hypothetical protein CDV55_104763 [Aspergillus turcosus]
MSKFKYTEHVPFRELIVEVEKVLRVAGIPSVLWDTCLLSTYGVPVHMEYVDFVVPDHQIDAAIQALRDVAFSDGQDFPFRCKWQEKKKEEMTRSAPWPAHWFHLHSLPWTPDQEFPEDTYNRMQQGSMHRDLCLHRKSEALWALPDLSLEDPAPDDPNYMLATDPRLPEHRPGFGRGRFTVPGCRLQIPTPTRYTESLFLIVAREWEMLDRGEFWVVYLYYMSEYVYKVSMDEDFISPATLDPSLGKIWKAYLDDNLPVKEYNRKYIVPLREDLISKGALPETAFPWAMRHEEVRPWILRMRAAGRFG